MHNADYASTPYDHHQHFPQTQNPTPTPNPIPIDPLYPAPPSYASASAPPFSANTYNPPPPPTPPSSTDYASYQQNYPPLQTPDPLPAATSYSQPQSAYSFPQFEAHGPYQPPSHPQLPSYYDQPSPTYTSNPNHNPISPNSRYPSIHPPAQSSQLNSNDYEPQYDIHDVNLSRSRSDLGVELYSKRAETGYGNDTLYGNNEGVYAYRGTSEPYGARGTTPNSSTWSGSGSGFDDFGRPIGYSSSSLSGKERPINSPLKVMRAVQKADAQQDPKSGVQKFRMKLLAETGGQTTMDVLCQIGLDGIRMLDPSTNRILRIYLLDTITRCEAIESSIFAFWSKSSVDIEPRRIRLKSNSYTTTTILDTVTAAIAQFQKEKLKVEKHTKKEKRREKKEKKKNNKEKKDKRSKKLDKSENVHGLTCDEKIWTATKVDLSCKLSKSEFEQLERSSLTEEHAKPVCLRLPSSSSNSTENSNKRKRQPSPVDVSRGHGKIIRIRLSSKKQNKVDSSVDEQKHCSTSGRTYFPAQTSYDSSLPLRNQGICSTSGVTSNVGRCLVLKTGGERIRSASKLTEVAASLALETIAMPVAVADAVMTTMSKEGLLYRNLIENWVLPQLHDVGFDVGDDDWLFEGKNKVEKSEKTSMCREEIVSSNTPSLWLRAQYLPEVSIYALPFTVPF